MPGRPVKVAAAGAAALGIGFRTYGREAVLPGELYSPARPKGGKSAMGLACEPIPVIRTGIIGLGMRGMDAVSRLLYVDGIEIKAVCDVIPQRVDQARAIVKERGRPEPAGYSAGPEDWRSLCERDDLDLVYICTPWYLHVPNAVHAMINGKHAAVEVPAATTR